MSECGWPFHNDKDCDTCKQYEAKYAESVDAWLEVKREVRAAAKRRKKNG